MIKRHISSLIKKRLKNYPVVALLGARQTGKTTLAKTFSGIYFDLELEHDCLRLDLQWEEVAESNMPVILDEAQNATPIQMKMLMTRIGEGSKIVITGDVEQTDRRTPDNGLLDLKHRIQKHSVPGMIACEFDTKEIRRHRIIEHILTMYT